MPINAGAKSENSSICEGIIGALNEFLKGPGAIHILRNGGWELPLCGIVVGHLSNDKLIGFTQKSHSGVKRIDLLFKHVDKEKEDAIAIETKTNFWNQQTDIRNRLASACKQLSVLADMSREGKETHCFVVYVTTKLALEPPVSSFVEAHNRNIGKKLQYKRFDADKSDGGSGNSTPQESVLPGTSTKDLPCVSAPGMKALVRVWIGRLKRDEGGRYLLQFLKANGGPLRAKGSQIYWPWKMKRKRRSATRTARKRLSPSDGASPSAETREVHTT